MALALKVVPDPDARDVHHAGVLDRRRHRDGLVELAVGGVLDELAEHAAQRLAGARLGDHAAALDQAAERGDGADLGPHEPLDLAQELRVRDVPARAHEGEGHLALERVGDAHHAGLGHQGVARDGLF